MSSIGDKYNFLSWMLTCVTSVVHFWLGPEVAKSRSSTFGATGYLHWGLNQWRGDDPTYESTGINLEGGNILPGGDSWIIYPGDKKLYGSIRLEAMRDGIADYTLLQMLARKDEALAKEICRQNVYGWTTYDMSTLHFRLARHQILEALSK